MLQYLLPSFDNALFTIINGKLYTAKIRAIIADIRLAVSTLQNVLDLSGK